jgi:hypothetical protein
MFSELNAEERRIIYSTFKRNSLSKDDLAIIEFLHLEDETENKDESDFYPEDEEGEEELIYFIERWSSFEAGGIADAS